MNKPTPTRTNRTLISIIVPMMNEEDNVAAMYVKLQAVFAALPRYRFEVIYVDDGSTDASVVNVQSLEAQHPEVRLIRLARNFGKEIATTAGLHHAKGKAAVMIDADLQHPPEVIPQFIAKWREGYDVVVGRRTADAAHASFMKRATSRWYYRLINMISTTEITPHATDFRLLDRAVINEFNRFTERNRMTRGLIDWLGFARVYVDFVPAKRVHGAASYTYRSLIKLAANSIISLSFFPLKLAGYLGSLIILVSGPAAVWIIINRWFMSNSMHFTGPAILAVMLLFLIGVVLVCLGLIALYIANIYGEVVNRPLYVEKRRLDQE